MAEGTFAAAHQLIGYDGPCENLHGHTFRVQVFVTGRELKKEGFVIDFKLIKNFLSEILSDFDHHNLNDLLIFKNENPTAENISRHIFLKMEEKMPVSRVTVWESATSSATYFK